MDIKRERLGIGGRPMTIAEALEDPRDFHSETDRKIAEHQIKAEEAKYNDTWESCCVRFDRRAVQFFTQIAIIVAVGAFCVARLSSDIGCESSQAYLGLLTLLIGLVVPAPTFGGAKKAN